MFKANNKPLGFLTGAARPGLLLDSAFLVCVLCAQAAKQMRSTGSRTCFWDITTGDCGMEYQDVFSSSSGGSEGTGEIWGSWEAGTVNWSWIEGAAPLLQEKDILNPPNFLSSVLKAQDVVSNPGAKEESGSPGMWCGQSTVFFTVLTSIEPLLYTRPVQTLGGY